MIFATYSSLIGESQSGGKYKTRFKQLLHWCGDDFDGVVSFQVKKKIVGRKKVRDCQFYNKIHTISDVLMLFNVAFWHSVQATVFQLWKDINKIACKQHLHLA